MYQCQLAVTAQQNLILPPVWDIPDRRCLQNFGALVAEELQAEELQAVELQAVELVAEHHSSAVQSTVP